MKKFIAALLTLIVTFPVFANCFTEAGHRYGIEPELLKAIATVESGLNPAATNKNNDGTLDLGMMQINSTHLPKLKKMKISQESLLNNSCQNVMIGAWILAGNMKKYGYSWDAVGAYNAGTSDSPKRKVLRQKYINKVAPQYLKIKQAQAESM